MEKIVIATRGSKLALWQAEFIQSELKKEHGLEVELMIIKTQGDKILDVPLAKIGGKGLFVKEIEEKLLDGTAQIAVHSMKDVPMDLPEGLELYVNTEGECPQDAFVSEKFGSLSELPQGAVVGTSSLRRKVQLLRMRPDLKVNDLRGNVNTRLRKLNEGEYDAIILAAAGLIRLGMEDVITEYISTEDMLPAVTQGILGIEVREDDVKTKELLKFLKHEPSETRARCERAYNRRLQGGCQAPIAGHSVIDGDIITIKGFVSDLNGEKIFEAEESGALADAENIGIRCADKVLEMGAGKVLEEIYAEQ